MTDRPVCPCCGQTLPQEPRLYSRPPDQLDPRRVAAWESEARERDAIKTRSRGADLPPAFQPIR